VAAATDPTLRAWRTEVATLGGRLVDLESDPTVAVARSGVLSGGSAATWNEADGALSAAWDSYRAVDEVVGRAEAEPQRAHELLTAAAITAVSGATVDATTALREATAAVNRAVDVLARLNAAWDTLATRNRAAQDAATRAGDGATARAAASLTTLLASDPLAVTEADVAAVEAQAAAASGKMAKATAAVGRLDVDLTRARATLARLDTDVQGAADELAHAASRIAGVSAGAPVPDLAALGAWLDRITASAEAGDRVRAAGALDDWFAAAEARRTELDGALAPARAGMRRREEGRGLWTALRAKAGARRVDEQPDVVAALDAAHDQLWQAPCDLAAAEAALATLAAVLEKRTDPNGGPR
jgi:hypothetical protein